MKHLYLPTRQTSLFSKCGLRLGPAQVRSLFADTDGAAAAADHDDDYGDDYDDDYDAVVVVVVVVVVLIVVVDVVVVVVVEPQTVLNHHS